MPVSTRLAFFHDDDAIGDFGHHAEIVSDDQHAHAGFPLQFLQQRQNLGLHRHVERGGRLVGDQEVGTQRKRHGDHHALTLAAGKLVRIFAHGAFRVGNAHPRQQAHSLAPGRSGLHPVGRHRLADLPSDGVDRVQMAERVLEDHRDPPAVCLASRMGRHGQQVLAVEQDLTGTDPAGRHVDKVHDRRRGYRFAGPAFAEDRQRLAAVEVIGDVSHRRHDAGRRMELDGEIANFQQMLSHSFGLSFPGASAEPDQARCAASSTKGSATRLS